MPRAKCVIPWTAFFVLLGFQISFAQWDESPRGSDDSLAPIPSSPSQKMSEPGSTPLRVGGLTESQRDLYRLQVNSGQSMYQVGRVMAWGGIAANILGSVANVPALSLVGSLSATIGIPVMGVAAGKAERGSLALNPSGNISAHTGWPVYWTGWGLQAGGILVIVSSISSNIETDQYGDEQLSESAVGPIIIGVVAIFAGAICHYIAWYQFSERLDQSTLNMAGLSYNPTLHIHDGRIDGAGLNLALAF